MSVFLAVVTAFLIGQSQVQIQAQPQPRPEPAERTVEHQLSQDLSRQPRATPRSQRVYYDSRNRLSSPINPQAYQCEHGAGGAVLSCWCNWNESAEDCRQMINSNVCGENATWWGGSTPGEYGCDPG